MKFSTKELFGELPEYYVQMRKELAEHLIYCAERELSELNEMPKEKKDTTYYKSLRSAIRKAKNLNTEILMEGEQ